MICLRFVGALVSNCSLSRYEGKWKNGQAHGRGVLLHARGDRYEGEC